MHCVVNASAPSTGSQAQLHCDWLSWITKATDEHCSATFLCLNSNFPSQQSDFNKCAVCAMNLKPLLRCLRIYHCWLQKKKWRVISINGNSSTEIYVTKLRSLVPDVTLQDTFNVFFLTLSQSSIFYIDVLGGHPCSTLFKWTPERWMSFKQNEK